MAAEEVALAHYRQRRVLVDALAAVARRMWLQVDPGNIARSWADQIVDLLVLTNASQLAAARTADVYLNDVLVEQGINPAAQGRVSAAALAGVASDGRQLDALLYQPAIATLQAVRDGVAVERALAGGYATLDMIVRTQVADAGRAADQVASTVRPQVSGYVRMVVGKTCSRCVVLAGKRYRWNDGFDRHPRCDCIHVPAREDTGGDIRTNPRGYFDSLSREEQDKAFTIAGAQAIRDGSNIAQVVNARRGALGLTPAGARITEQEARALRGGRARGRLEAVDVFGREVFVTTEGVTTRGIAGKRLGAVENGSKRDGGRYRSVRTPRLMPESIYALSSGNRDEAIRLLRRFGYIT